jgi:hypothetical protein
MGQSKIPFYAYVDETGNTGHNLFDEAQPDFYTAALITKGDFDLTSANAVRNAALKVGSETLHAKKLGIQRLETIAPDIAVLLRSSNAHFFVSRVEKRYLLATKIFDSLFDSGENAAVSWHHYNLRALRVMLAFKLASIVEEVTAKLFWQCIMEPKKERVLEMLPAVCEALEKNIDQVPDAKSRQVLGDGLKWAKTHPEAIQIHTDRKIAKQGHFPNMVAFANLLDGLEHYSKRFKRPVARITHDQQSEFEKTLAIWHEMYSNASSEEVRWAGETYSLQKVVGSKFEVRSDPDSPGIQIADVVLWLYSQLKKGKDIPAGCTEIMDHVFAHGWESDFSFSGVHAMYIEKFGPILAKPLSEEKEKAVRAQLEELEKARLASMARYEKDGLPPFERERKSITTAT